MDLFATNKVFPISIAWCVNYDDWDSLEEIIKYNCGMVGGYYNIIVPVFDGNITDVYQKLITDYDPDFIVLASGMPLSTSDLLEQICCPFDILSWEQGKNEFSHKKPFEDNIPSPTLPLANQINPRYIAVSYPESLSYSKLTLLACGDVEPTYNQFCHIKRGIKNLNFSSYQGEFLFPTLKEGLILESLDESNSNPKSLPFPNRLDLDSLLQDQYKIPTGKSPFELIKIVTDLQSDSYPPDTFINLTRSYNNNYNFLRKAFEKFRTQVGIVILLSDELDFEQASLFWNLRANNTYVVWIAFSDFEKYLEEIVSWLDEDKTPDISKFSLQKKTIALTTPNIPENQTRLRVIASKLETKTSKHNLKYKILDKNQLTYYDVTKPNISEDYIIVSQNNSKCSFIPKLHSKCFMCSVLLEWPHLMLPQDSKIAYSVLQSDNNFISSIKNFARNGIPENIEEEEKLRLKRLTNITLPYTLRITKDNYIKTLIRPFFSDQPSPVTFNKPNTTEIFSSLFSGNKYKFLEETSAAKYHNIFIGCCGGLEQIPEYLTSEPYKRLFDILRDNTRKNKDTWPGWILEKPDRRRVLHHFHLRQVLDKTLPETTLEYFEKECDILPKEAIDLLEKQLLERGFVLGCSICSFKSWYPTEQVGQLFTCYCCSQPQIYRGNLVSFYKLPEVIYQGFQDNMQVPLLTLSWLKKRSKFNFQWLPDSNIYWDEDNEEKHQNIDILCLLDGKAYIGEAKSCDDTDSTQFGFYENLCRNPLVEGIVFATSKPEWKPGTIQKIENLKRNFHGEVIVLREKDLYPII